MKVLSLVAELDLYESLQHDPGDVQADEFLELVIAVLRLLPHRPNASASLSVCANGDTRRRLDPRGCDTVRLSAIDGNEWRLDSTDGYSALIGVPVSAAGLAVVHDVRLEATEPQRTALTTRIALSRTRIASLVDALQGWLAQPLRALAIDDFEHSSELAAESWQVLRISFGRSDAVITTAGQSVCVVEVRNGIEARLVFATEPTCLQLLCDGRQRLLEASR